MSKYLMSSSPHITSAKTTRNIMLDVIIALMPAVIAMVAIYGFYPLLITLLSVGTCVLSEFLFNKIRKKEQSIGDLSAIVTGIILALNLPPVVPIYVPVVGGVFAIVIVKMLFGGIGRNFANPAVTARIFLMLAWTSVMTSFVLPVDWSQTGGAGLFSYFKEAFGTTFPSLPETITGATPLAGVKSAFEAGANPTLGIKAADMFLGRIGGSAGEVSSLAILIGGVYLLVRRVIHRHDDSFHRNILCKQRLRRRIYLVISFGRRFAFRRVLYGNRLCDEPEHDGGGHHIFRRLRIFDGAYQTLFVHERGRFVCHSFDEYRNAAS